jgi:hypothetical protein
LGLFPAPRGNIVPLSGFGVEPAQRFFDILAKIEREISKIIFEKVIKSAWRMPWLSEAKKDVTSCDKLRGGANIHYIRRFPNGATHHVEGVIS